MAKRISYALLVVVLATLLTIISFSVKAQQPVPLGSTVRTNTNVVMAKTRFDSLMQCLALKNVLGNYVLTTDANGYFKLIPASDVNVHHAGYGLVLDVDTFIIDSAELDNRYLKSYTESDPIYTGSDAANITNTDISNWDAAYGWGNHASAGYESLSNKATSFVILNNNLYPSTQAVANYVTTAVSAIDLTAYLLKGDSSLYSSKYRVDTMRSNIYAALSGKQSTITTGTTSQYFKGDLSLGTFSTDVRAQISATGTGISYNSSTGVITGSALTSSNVSGTANYVAYFTGANTIGNSVLYQTSSKILIGTTTDAGTEVLQVNGNALINGIRIGHFSDANTLAIGGSVLGNSGGPCSNSLYIGSSSGLNANSTYGTGLGYLAGNRDRGSYNYFAGAFSGPQTAGHNLTGQQNVGIGYYALNGIQDGASYNTAIGIQAGQSIGTGNKNILIGAQAGAALVNVDGCVMIGHNAGSLETVGNKLYVDNSNTSAPLIYGDFSTDSLQFNGKTVFTSKSYWSATNTAGGTTGNQTINKPSGTVNVAAGGTSITVTNNLVTSKSIVWAVIRTNDATASIKNVVPSAGSFTINLSAAVTGETSIGFLVIN